VDRLYLVRGVDVNYNFVPQTQFEIKNIRWFNIFELPEHKKDTNPAVLKSGVPMSNFYSVYPYVKRLKTWIIDKAEGKNKIQNFKVRPEPGENQQYGNFNQGNQRNSKQFQSNTPGIGKHLEPFQFPLQFLESGGGSSVTSQGWQLFPQAQGDMKPYPMTSNALQELLLSSQQAQSQQQPQQQQQHQQVLNRQNNLGNVKTATNVPPNTKANKNPRRRLFSEEFTQGPEGAGIIGKPSNKKVSPHHQNKASSSQTQSRTQIQLSAPAWVNFTFDRERLYKAFFTPPPTTVPMS